MTDFTTPVTDQEYQIFSEFGLEKGIELDGPTGQKNGTLFGNHLADRKQRITKENLEAIYTDIKGQIVHVNPVQAEYNRVVLNFSDYDRDFIAAKLASYGYETTNEQSLLVNWTLVAKAFQARCYAVTNDNFKVIIGNLAASPDGHKLIQKTAPKRFDAAAAKKEYEAKRNTVQREEGPYFDPVSGTTIRPLTGHLKDYRDNNLHKPVTKIEPDPQNLDKLYDRKLEDLLNAVQSNVIRDEARQLARKLVFAGAKSKETFEEVQTWLERRLHDRRTSGYMS
jgi:hypothetical protein